MPVEFLENPRRAPRVRIRCVVSVSTGFALPVRAFSEDVGPHGCQLVAPRPFEKGARLLLEFQSEETDQLRASATVAWANPHEPWRLGVAFDDVSRPAATRFFDRLMARRPGLASWRQVPDRVSIDTVVWLAPPPRLVVDFTADEVVLLRVVGSGATVYELMSRLGDRAGRLERAFFSLLTSGAITLSRGGSIPFASWSDLLRRLEAEHAVAALDQGSSGPAPSAAPPAPAPRPAPPGTAPADGAAGLDVELDQDDEGGPVAPPRPPKR